MITHPHTSHTLTPHICTLSKETLCFIKHQYGIAMTTLSKYGIDILTALTHPLTEQLTTVDYLHTIIQMITSSLM